MSKRWFGQCLHNIPSTSTIIIFVVNVNERQCETTDCMYNRLSPAYFRRQFIQLSMNAVLGAFLKELWLMCSPDVFGGSKFKVFL